MPAASLVASVLAKLVDIHTGLLPAGFPVSTGVPVGDVPDRYAAVGYGGDDRAGIVGQGEPSPYAGMTTETFGIWCTLSAATGDNNPTGQLAVVDGLFQPIAASLRADKTLGGVVPAPGVAELGPYEWTVEPADYGAIVTVFYQVVVRGMILA